MEYSIGILELRSIAKGIQASDEALKSAGIQLVTAQPICPGKFELVLSGQLAQVNAAMEKIRTDFSDYAVDSVLLGRIDPSVIKALLGGQPEARHGALGTIETFSGSFCNFCGRGLTDAVFSAHIHPQRLWNPYRTISLQVIFQIGNQHTGRRYHSIIQGMG